MSQPDPRFATAWAHFQTLDDLTLAPETVEGQWTVGRSAYLAFLVPIEDGAVREYLAGMAGRIDGIAGVDLYPGAYWHMTVKGVGFEVQDSTGSGDELASSEVPRITEAARRIFANASRFEARIGLANGFPEVVFAEVWNADAVPMLNSRLMVALPELPIYPFDGGNFLPHVSIARFTSSEGLSELKATIARLRDNEPGPAFNVSRVDLVRAHLHEQAPDFETIASYELRA